MFQNGKLKMDDWDYDEDLIDLIGLWFIGWLDDILSEKSKEEIDLEDKEKLDDCFLNF